MALNGAVSIVSIAMALNGGHGANMKVSSNKYRNAGEIEQMSSNKYRNAWRTWGTHKVNTWNT